MKAIYLDCFAGISGNMLLGAFLSAGVPAAYLKEELSKLPVMDECVIESSEAKKNGILSIYVDVRLANGHHPEEPETDQEQQHQGHRSLSDIQALLEASELSRPVKHMALQIFDELAVAEGKVHGLPKENVYFHEVGAIDSIVDIVGTAICLDYLEIEKVFVSKVNTGSGFVACAHGTMMVPAPATAELLKGGGGGGGGGGYRPIMLVLRKSLRRQPVQRCCRPWQNMLMACRKISWQKR
jgi:uncharacterized protein (DUF111 family)